jgi:YVTN family beta-propeller protein
MVTHAPSRRLLSLILVLTSGYAGCGDGNMPGTDSGGSEDSGLHPDGGGSDGAAPDGGIDSGNVDAGTVDAGNVDAGTVDASTVDGGSDAGTDAWARPACSCPITATGPTRGSAIALTPDDATLVSVNRDVGTVTVAHVDWTGADPSMTVTAELALGPTSEPWQVAIDACGECAYVVTREAQQVVRIEGLDTATPSVGPQLSVGSEPTALALTPNNATLYVTNWVDGTVTAIDPVTMTATGTIDLNETLVATGYVGSLVARPALAHPRAIAITNNGDAYDDDETVLVTEWFAQRVAPESAAGADTTHVGLVYRFGVGTATASVIELPAVTDTGFADHTGGATGCYPNQIASITIDGAQAYVTSTCASPRGPLGVFTRGSCTSSAACVTFGGASTCDTTQHACTLACTMDADCGTGAAVGACQLPSGICRPNTSDVRTTTHPALSTVDLGAGTAITETLDTFFAAPAVASARMPLLPTDVAFNGGTAFLAAEGADAVFRIAVSATGVTSVGSSAQDFINLRRPTGDSLIRLPIGIASASAYPYAFVANDGSRDVTALELAVDAIAGDQVADFRITSASTLPAAGSIQDSILRGRRFFTTGLGRWSLSGAAWGACAACHVDGLTDAVTWYFARGPRQSTSLDGSFASSDPTDQRIFNWTAINDEVADFEGNVRGVSGGVGAIVSMASSPPVGTDRIDTAGTTPPQQGLQGSSSDVADPVGTSPHAHSLIGDWNDIRNYIRTIRSPRAPTTLVAADVDSGRAIFGSTAQGNCVGCHSGAKWTISRVFYSPGDVPNDATASAAVTSLSSISWNIALGGFPTALFPTTTMASQRMRFGSPPAAEQIQCALRPVGTFGVSDPAIGVLELRQDMITAAQGNGVSSGDPARGYNVPSLLGLSVGGAYFHGGNARTLEEVFDARFLQHHQSAVASVFSPSAAQVRQLVAYLLSIDESTTTYPIPARGYAGGDLCFYP